MTIDERKRRIGRVAAVTLMGLLTWAASPNLAFGEEPCGGELGEILRVEGEVKAPVKVFAEPPVYTEAARKERVQGAVIVETIIDEKGDVVQIRLLEGQPLGLSAEAMATIARWKFEPATLDGEPVSVYYNLTINFRLE